MALTFNPTITRTAILADNTSASDTFPGWPNGVAKPSAIGLSPLPIPQQKLVHIVPWWGTNSHPNIGYNSADQVYISRLVADLKRRGIDGATWLWNGPSGPMDLACLMMKPQFEAAGLKFAIMLSSTIPAIQAQTDDAGRTKALNGIVDYLKTNYFTSPAYLRVPNGRPELFFFGFSNNDFDWTLTSPGSVRSHLHAMGTNEAWCVFRMEINYGAHLCADGYFGWMDNSDAWVAFAKKFGKPLVIGINGGFNNTQRTGTVVNCTWGTPNVIDQQGGLKLLAALAQAAKHPEIPQAQVGTWNDYQEGTPIEPGIASKQSIGLFFNDAANTLSWNDPGAAFDHLTLYVSNDGENLMPIADDIRGVTEVPLAGYNLPVGPWTFLVAGFGKNSIQNIVSNPVTASEFVDWK